jgi:hypothetical protein
MNLGLKGVGALRAQKIFVANAWSFMVVVRIGRTFSTGSGRALKVRRGGEGEDPRPVSRAQSLIMAVRGGLIPTGRRIPVGKLRAFKS